mmetsp:Transcript_131736/g.196304  ORF Transcript_131736/g.196304 Transcript_131736/m.196304 type:complete len:287 (+) Transcript_131736:34-894(+)
MADEIDLDALLESALDDFKADPDPPRASTPKPKPTQTTAPAPKPAPTPSPDEMLNPMEAFAKLLSDPSMKADFERDFGNMMNEIGGGEGNEPFSLDKLQAELEKQMANDFPTPPSNSSNSTPSPTASNSTPEDNLSATLQNLMNSAKDLQQDNGEFGEESIMDMFKEIENNPELSSMMESMMDKFMSKEVLYEGLKELQTKFQEWLAKKKQEGTLTEELVVQYETQLDSIGRVLAIYDANENDESTAAEAEELMRQMEEVGTLPDEVLNEIAKPGLGDGAPPCSIM